MKRSKTTLVQKLFGYYFALSLVTIIILSLYSYFTSKNALISRTYDQLNSVKFEKERNIENYFRERSDEVNQISRYENWEVILRNAQSFHNKMIDDIEFRSVIFSEFTNKIRKHLGGNYNYKNIIVKGQDFSLVIQLEDSLSLNSISLQHRLSEDILKKFREIENVKHLSIVEDIFRKKIYLGVPINDGNNTANKGVIFMEIDMASINSIMFNTNVLNGLGKTGEAYVVGSDRIMRTSSRFKSNSINKQIVKTFAVDKAFQNLTGTGEYKDYRDITVLGSYGKINIPGLNWVILVEIDLEEAMIPIYTLRNSIIILSLIISIIIFGIVLIISRRVSSPIVKLKLAADSISRGDYDTELENDATDEIGDLTRAFNKMSGKIKMQTEEIQEERSKRITSVIDGQEQERQRLSRELHDGLGQHILAIKMKLERAEKAGPELKQQIIDEAKNLLTEVSREVVSMSENLMPPVLTQFGLISAIENLCEEIRSGREIELRFSYNDIPEKCDNQIKIYLYRIIQEALNNIVKHAQATRVEINFRFEDPEICLNIIDNGIGFDPGLNRKTGNGIYNMSDRADILGGTFTIKSAPGKGTNIEVKLTINN
jgi:signal transduction histidine kinase